MSKAKCAQGGISIGMEELQSFQKYLELEEKERATVQKYMRDVRSFLDFAGGSPVTKERVIAYKAWLAEQYAPRSANSMLVALNGFLRYLGADGCCVKLFRLQYQTFCERQRVLTQEEYKRLLDTARRKRQTRLYLILLTLCSTGIRISELKHITVEAIRQGSAVARNKGKSRVVLLPRRLCELLNGYVRWRGIESGPVFLTRGGKPVDRSNVWRSMQRLCREAGVSKAKAHPHSLRHLFACTFYEKEKDVMHLADILGHKSVNTTRIYTLTVSSVHRRQIESLNLFLPEAGEGRALFQKQHNDILCRHFREKKKLG